MGKKIVLAVLFLITQGLVVAAQNKKFTLVIDAGHGGHDAGALGASSKEKNINLNVALAFGNYVERNCPDGMSPHAMTSAGATCGQIWNAAPSRQDTITSSRSRQWPSTGG